MLVEVVHNWRIAAIGYIMMDQRIIKSFFTLQESHKQMDEDAEIEAELQRQEELEDARNNMELPLPKDKEMVRLSP